MSCVQEIKTMETKNKENTAENVRELSPAERVTRDKVIKSAQAIDMMSLMGMNRHERRALASLNNAGKITGTNKPYVKSNT